MNRRSFLGTIISSALILTIGRDAFSSTNEISQIGVSGYGGYGYGYGSYGQYGYGYGSYGYGYGDGYGYGYGYSYGSYGLYGYGYLCNEYGEDCELKALSEMPWSEGLNLIETNTNR